MCHICMCVTSLICVWHASFMCVTSSYRRCDMPHSYMGHASFICGTCFIHIWDMPHLHVGHASFICVTWFIHMCNMTHSCVWYASFICYSKSPGFHPTSCGSNNISTHTYITLGRRRGRSARRYIHIYDIYIFTIYTCLSLHCMMYAYTHIYTYLYVLLYVGDRNLYTFTIYTYLHIHMYYCMWETGICIHLRYRQIYDIYIFTFTLYDVRIYIHIHIYAYIQNSM